MQGTVAVIIATYGDRQYWDTLAARALHSVATQTRQPEEIIRIHADTLHKARNLGAAQATTEWLIFLDADDELHPFYIEKIMTGRGDLRQPSITNISPNGSETRAYVLPITDLIRQNFLVIGTMIRREQFLRVGGFDDYPVLEDWALWIKAWIDGAIVGSCPEAIYRIHLRPRSRNQQHGLHRPIQEQILRKLAPLVPPSKKNKKTRSRKRP